MASMIVTFPTVWTHLIGQVLYYMGENNIVFGSDSLWYGAPRWQIEAFWRFQIPQDMAKKYGYPALTERAKRQILGLNSANLYRVSNRVASYRPVPPDYEGRIPDSTRSLVAINLSSSPSSSPNESANSTR